MLRLMGRNALLSAILLLLPALLFSQKGMIEGTLSDEATGETLIGAIVMLFSFTSTTARGEFTSTERANSS